jgi:hypothetical protein
LCCVEELEISTGVLTAVDRCGGSLGLRQCHVGERGRSRFWSMPDGLSTRHGAGLAAPRLVAAGTHHVPF